MKRFKALFTSFVLIAGILGLTAATVVPVSAAPIDPQKDICAGTGGTGGAGGCSGNSTQDNLGPIIKTIVNVLLYIIGAVAVIVIVIGGLRYVTSGGDSSKVAGAKNTILYAVVGLIIAILAFAIVNFVIGAFK